MDILSKRKQSFCIFVSFALMLAERSMIIIDGWVLIIICRKDILRMCKIGETVVLALAMPEHK